MECRGLSSKMSNLQQLQLNSRQICCVPQVQELMSTKYGSGSPMEPLKNESTDLVLSLLTLTQLYVSSLTSPTNL